MGKNSIQSLPADKAVLLANHIAGVAGSGPSNPFGISLSVLSAMIDASGEVQIDGSLVESTLAAYREAIQNRAAHLNALRDAIATAARQAYASPTVTPAMIASLNLSPRSTDHARIVPKTPEGVVVSALSNGDVAISWNRGTNPRGVGFAVEARFGTDDWSLAANTTATKATLSGYALGGPVEFRVIASRNGTMTSPSSVASLFPAPSTRPNLRVAA